MTKYEWEPPKKSGNLLSYADGTNGSWKSFRSVSIKYYSDDNLIFRLQNKPCTYKTRHGYGKEHKYTLETLTANGWQLWTTLSPYSTKLGNKELELTGWNIMDSLKDIQEKLKIEEFRKAPLVSLTNSAVYPTSYAFSTGKRIGYKVTGGDLLKFRKIYHYSYRRYYFTRVNGDILDNLMNITVAYEKELKVVLHKKS
jgi:hypothetical protein